VLASNSSCGQGTEGDGDQDYRGDKRRAGYELVSLTEEQGLAKGGQKERKKGQYKAVHPSGSRSQTGFQEERAETIA
jgi:hypothetical protein